jgi:esterase/lipase superfamily enzyme
METKSDIIYSNHLNREMPINIYGHYGISVLMFPALGESSLEYENNGLISALEPLLKIGKCKIFCVSGIDSEIWFGQNPDFKEKSHTHFKFNNFIEDEVIPYIYSQCGGPLPIISAGASRGAYHAANMFFRRPDMFMGTIALSGFYDLSVYTGDYFDDNCYFNSPIHYLPNLNDNYWLSLLYSRRHIYLASGTGEGENHFHTQNLANILTAKDIRHHLEIRGDDFGHNYKSWNELFKFFIEERL